VTTRGTLRVYLGAAPGVGKTFAMLDEASRRRERGTDVVIAFVETHGRAHTADQMGTLEVVPRRSIVHRGVTFSELDLDAVLARHPHVALVDELAHTNVPGSRNAKRWQDVEAMLDAGIDVLSTLNIQHLESLNDVVREITGVTQLETVPDSVVRAAEQVELIDMTPEALRRRMAHGNIYPPEKVDAALGNYFRPGNLTALRELALLWVADSVEEGMQRYREQHGITGQWETRERIVVGLTGGPEGDALIRRAARITARTVGADLLAVHVERSDGLAGAGLAALVSQRSLVESLGGTYHSVLGEDVAKSLLAFARSVDATQIVLGVSRRRPWSAALLGPGTSTNVARNSGPIDVHLVTHEYIGRGLGLPPLGRGLTARRRLIGFASAAGLLAVITAVLASLRSDLSFSSDVSIYLFAVIISSLIGGFYPALTCAVAGSVLLNYYFAPPLHTFTISERNNVIALVIFLLVAALVSRVVDLAARRSSLAARASAEAETMSVLGGSLLRGGDALPTLLDRVRETFGMRSVSLLQRRRDDPGWDTIARVGADAPTNPGEGDSVAEIDDRQILVMRGKSLAAEDQRVLAAFAAQVGAAYRQRLLAEAASAVEPLAQSERARTALLNAVSHDLRTPLASAKASVSSLRAADVAWSDADRSELLATADESLDRLTDLVTNLLDLSRLQAGVLPVLCAPVGLDDVVSSALDHAVHDGVITIDVPADLPEVLADAGLLERVVANLVQNAVRYTPEGVPVLVAASAHDGKVELRVVDRGRGIDRADAGRVFAPFQRLDDSPTSGAGVGLGLAIARGFAEAMGGSVSAEETPGGGATLVVSLDVAKPGVQ
jgi:two-component system, OmpR family, sensor histidine kinase KdpD